MKKWDFSLRKTRFSTYIIVTVVMFVLLSILSTSLVFVFAEYNRLDGEILQTQQVQTAHTASLLNAYLDRYRIYIYNLLDDGDVQVVLASSENWNINMQRVSREINSACNNDPFIQSIMLYNNRDLHFITQQPNNILVQEAYDSIYETALNGTQRQFTSLAQVMPSDSCMLMTLVQPFDRKSGLAVNVNLTKLTDRLFPQSTEILYALTDPYDNILCASREITDLEATVLEDYLQKQTDMPSSANSFIVTTAEAYPEGYSVLCIQNSGRSIFRNASFQYAVKFVVVLLLLLIIVAIFMARRLTKPIEDLSSAIIRYADTPLPQRIDMNSVADSARKLYTDRQDMEQKLESLSWRTLLSIPGNSIKGHERVLFDPLLTYRSEHIMFLLQINSEKNAGEIGVSSELVMSALETEIKNTLNSHFFHKVVRITENQYVVVLREIEGDATLSDLDAGLQASLMRDAVQSVLHGALIIIYGPVSTSPNYGDDVNELKQLLRYRVLDGENWTGYSAKMEANRINASVPDAICRNLLNTVFAQDALGLEKNIDCFIHQIQSYRLHHALSAVARVLDEADLKICAVMNEKADAREINAEHMRRIAVIQTQHAMKNFIIEVCAQTMQVLGEKQNSTQRDLMDDVFEYVSSHLTASDLSVQAIAQRFSVSHSYFSRLFNSTMQQSFPQYVNEMRLERGKELLENTDSDIKDIAEQVGFNSASYFCVLFQRRYGLSPSKFRLNTVKNKNNP